MRGLLEPAGGSIVKAEERPTMYHTQNDRILQERVRGCCYVHAEDKQGHYQLDGQTWDYYVGPSLPSLPLQVGGQTCFHQTHISKSLDFGHFHPQGLGMDPNDSNPECRSTAAWEMPQDMEMGASSLQGIRIFMEESSRGPRLLESS